MLKHGNRASSSQCGSADVYEVLGIAIDLGPEQVAGLAVVEAGFGFAMAPRFHASMRHAGPTRRELGIPTAFNILGPIANPAGVRRQVVGSGRHERGGEAPAGARSRRGRAGSGRARRRRPGRADHDHDQLGVRTAGRCRSRATRSIPTAFGLATAAPDDLLGGTADVNADSARRVLAGEAGAHRDIVVLNAAAGFLVADRAADLAEGVALAQAAIDDGRAEAKLAEVIELSPRLSAG